MVIQPGALPGRNDTLDLIRIEDPAMTTINSEIGLDRESISTGRARCIDTELSSNEVGCSVLAESSPPLFVEPTGGVISTDRSAFMEWVDAHPVALDQLIVKHGGIVLRGFPLRETEGFEALVGHFPAYSAGYLGGSSPRQFAGSKCAGIHKLGVGPFDWVFIWRWHTCVISLQGSHSSRAK